MIRGLLHSQLLFFFAYAVLSGAVFSAVVEYRERKASEQLTLILIQIPVRSLTDLNI